MTDTDMIVRDIKKRMDKLYESLQWPHWGTGDIMTMEEILKGESENLEFKVDIPTKSEKYMRTVVAFANGNGGKIVFGVEDKTLRIVGFDEDDATQKIDTITNAIWDSCSAWNRKPLTSLTASRRRPPSMAWTATGIWN